MILPVKFQVVKRRSPMHFTYCPHCGNKLIDREIGDEGMIPFCEACQVPLWDMFSTCVICAVINEFDEIALIRQQYVSATNYVCVAGIIQLGENAEETAIKEIKEEIGLDVKKIQYICSYFYDKKHMLM
jgi:NAD+ diphosphatase